MDLNYFLELDIKDTSQNNLLYNAFNEIAQDTLKKSAFFYMGVINYQNRSYDLANINFKQYIDFYPSDIKASLAIGNIYFSDSFFWNINKAIFSNVFRVTIMT